MRPITLLTMLLLGCVLGDPALGAEPEKKVPAKKKEAAAKGEPAADWVE